MTGGDSAIVAIQYSYLPSWISYLVDQKEAREAGRDLFDAVYERWSTLPQNDAAEAARLRREPRLVRRRDGVQRRARPVATAPTARCFAGPPNFNTLYREFIDNRDPGSPEVAADLPQRPDRPVRRHDRRRHPAADVRPVGRAAGALRPAPVGPDRLVVAAPAAERAGLAARAARLRRARPTMRWAAVRHVLAGDAGPAGRDRRCRPVTATSTRRTTSTPGRPCCNPRAGPTPRRPACATSSPASTDPTRRRRRRRRVKGDGARPG